MILSEKALLKSAVAKLANRKKELAVPAENPGSKKA